MQIAAPMLGTHAIIQTRKSTMPQRRELKIQSNCYQSYYHVYLTDAKTLSMSIAPTDNERNCLQNEILCK